MRVAVTRLALFILLVFAGPVSIYGGQIGSSTPSKVTLRDLSFISGLWQAEWAGGLGEEHWSPSSGDSMVGTFRFVKDGKARFYEFMLIEATPDGPVLRQITSTPG